MKKILLIIVVFFAGFSNISCDKEIEASNGPDWGNVYLSGTFKFSEIKRFDGNYLEIPIANDGVDIILADSKYGDYNTWEITFKNDYADKSLDGFKIARVTGATAAVTILPSLGKSYQWYIVNAFTYAIGIRELGGSSLITTISKLDDNTIIYRLNTSVFKAGVEGFLEFHFKK